MIGAAMDAGPRGHHATGLPSWGGPPVRSQLGTLRSRDALDLSFEAGRPSEDLKIVGWDGSGLGPFWTMA